MQQAKLFLEHGFELSDDEFALFDRFLTLFMEYNSHTNLSAIRDEEGITLKHFIDSLYGASIIQDAKGKIQNERVKNSLESLTNHEGEISDGVSSKLLDIGSGGGFPGIPLKIVIPELDVTLLDSVGKKVKAMNYFVEELGLTGIGAIQERAENLAKDPEHCGKYDYVVSRATAYMTDILTWARPFLKPEGKIILYKMPSEDEAKEIRKITKKLGLILEGELTYTLGEKERILYTFAQRA